MHMTAESLAGAIDHTLLRPEATPAQIDVLCDDAVKYGFATVCVNPCFVRRAVRRLAEATNGPGVTSVVGFPLGANTIETKADEARHAMDHGATELDMVIHVGALIAGDGKYVRAEIEAVAQVVHGSLVSGVLKVILETAALTEAQIVAGCRCCAEAQADFVKTSTGFHAAGGATVEHVRLLHRTASPLRVKASGGIRTLASAQAMLAAGAVRLGTSSGVAIVEGFSPGQS